jgi:hypothetical protein
MLWGVAVTGTVTGAAATEPLDLGHGAADPYRQAQPTAHGEGQTKLLGDHVAVLRDVVTWCDGRCDRGKVHEEGIAPERLESYSGVPPRRRR